MTAGLYQFEIMYPHFLRKLVRRYQIRVFRKDLQTHVFEHRQCQWCFPAVNLESYLVFRILHPPIEVEAKFLSLEDGLDFIYVVKCQFGVEALLVSSREGVSVSRPKPQAFFLTPFFQQGVIKIIRPAARGVNQSPLQLHFINFWFMFALERTKSRCASRQVKPRISGVCPY